MNKYLTAIQNMIKEKYPKIDIQVSSGSYGGGDVSGCKFEINNFKDLNIVNWTFYIHSNPSNCGGLYLHGLSPRPSYDSKGLKPLVIPTDETVKWFSEFISNLITVTGYFAIQCSANTNQTIFYDKLETIEGWTTVKAGSRDRLIPNKYFTYARLRNK